MFRKILICAMFATAAGYCFAAENLPQIVTSEVFYQQEKIVDEGQWEQVDTTTYDVVETQETYTAAIFHFLYRYLPVSGL